jgi:hypothetical protein
VNIDCESLPCPCSSAAGGGSTFKPKTSCSKPQTLQNITFSSTKYPTIRQHFLEALRKGWPRILVINRPGAERPSSAHGRAAQGCPARESVALWVARRGRRLPCGLPKAYIYGLAPSPENAKRPLFAGVSLKPTPGFEPGTPSLRVKCSTS